METKPSNQAKKVRISFNDKKRDNSAQKSVKDDIIQKVKIKEHVSAKVDAKNLKQSASNKYPNAESIKLVFLGDGNCGKTSALISYTSNKFNPDYLPTVFDNYESIIRRGQTMVRLQLWDTAGQEQYKKLRSLSYPKTDIFFICFSMIDNRSFVNALQKWHNQVKQNCPRAQIIFVGTKIDLKYEYLQQKRSMTKSECQFLNQQQVQKKINALGYKLMVCSAMTQVGLYELFDTAIDKIVQKRKRKEFYKKSEQMQCQLI